MYILYAPLATRLCFKNVPRRERLGLVIFLGIGFYLVKVLYSPQEFKFVDELQHWRTMLETLRSGHLFQFNPILPVSPLYPGLENVTAALSVLTGLSIFSSGILVVGVARLVFTLALYLLYERLSGSAQVAGIASALYMTTPHYMFLTAYFIYQSLAIPLAGLVLYLIARREQAGDKNRGSYSVAIIVVAGGLDGG